LSKKGFLGFFALHPESLIFEAVRLTFRGKSRRKKFVASQQLQYAQQGYGKYVGDAEQRIG
jgi:hypothetical protein